MFVELKGKGQKMSYKYRQMERDETKATKEVIIKGNEEVENTI